MKRLVILSAWFAVAACSPGEEEAAAPSAPSVVSPVDGETALPGPDAGNFVGSWAARASWCANATGPERPIRITTTTFEGYEYNCRISQVRQANSAYEAVLDCTAEGTTTRERVRMRVVEDRLTLSWLDRAGSTSTEFVRCPAPQPEPVPIPWPTIAAPEPTG